ncbi:acyl-CoA dehydrogenase family protein [Rhodococcus sp. 077-4]|uniref:acyl-CoA dehydrogenase family protein n=1 Tax=Rhodococcus sp. 077-4 TaxID=2789271 RepID=UPI0039F6188F
MSVFDADQQMLADSVRAVLAKKSDSGAVRSAMESPDRFDRSLWAVLAEQVGVAGIAIPEDFDGSGGGPVEAAIVAEELGRTLTPSPFLGSSGVAAAVILATRDTDAKTRLLSTISDGSAIVALCAADGGGQWFGSRPPTITATERDLARGDFALSGTAHFVLDAGAATAFVVAARLGTDLALFEVDATASGISMTSGASLDPTRALYDVEFDRTPAGRLESSDASAALEHAITWGTVLLAAEQAGAAARCLELTVEYTKSRVQFGRPIGSFQALKHRMADLYVLVRSARATAYAAAAAVDDTEFWHDAAAVAAVYCAESLSTVAAECVQLHGGIAITWEHDMQLYFKRAHSSAQLFGLPRTHVRSLASAAGL